MNVYFEKLSCGKMCKCYLCFVIKGEVCGQQSSVCQAVRSCNVKTCFPYKWFLALFSQFIVVFYASSSQRYLRYIENVKGLRDIRVRQVFAFLLNISKGFILILYILVRVYIFICICCGNWVPEIYRNLF